ncbi:insulin-like growth factor-binding protein 1 isoform X1 [Coregonus clupeaformis]|uniref:insulin-like growth factor-binding protein 1 isoform X1 n=1 Tax=Coregonus clupeaformis TaxID=59861 RepID=UPI001BE07667|nr:insulin-like growth factor-binding protein 1 isoform X1 [Coregonus clupeaformis]
MLGLYDKLNLLAAVSLSLLTSLALSSPVVGPEPIRCAPCTQEKLDECPAISPDCKQVLREPGCGCCLACALEKGASCGVYTAHCAEGLKCSPRPGDPRPLHSLTRGQAICTEDQGQEEVERVPDLSSLPYLLGLNTPFDTSDDGAQESIKAKVNAIRKKLVEQGPCHIELHAALDRIASSQQELGEKFTTFYLPNCDKNGFYKAKQCESSLVGPPASCWCVSSWNGKKILGSNDLLGGSECQQELTH